MSAFWLKIIALISMIIDHSIRVFPELTILLPLGRIAFPIFVYLLAEGFRHTRYPLKFLARLFIFALISQPPFDWVINEGEIPWGVDFFSGTNIFYTLFLGGASIYLYNVLKPKIGFLSILPLFIFMIIAAFVLTTDYGAYGVLFIFIMYAIKTLKLRLFAMVLLCLWQLRVILEQVVLYWAFGQLVTFDAIFLLMIPSVLLSVLFVSFYNGERGTNIKWLFYAAYPIHLLVLAFIMP